MFERFTNMARLSLSMAQEEARGLQHDFIDTEHLLLGVVGCGDDAVIQALAGCEFTLDDLRERIRDVVLPGDAEPSGQPPFTPRAKKVLELSLREALAMGHDHIGPAHVLLGILREGEGVGSQVLVEQGVDHERMRLWVAQSMGEGGPRRRGRGRRMRMRDAGRLSMNIGTPPANRLREWAEAQEGQLGTHHFLLGMFEEAESMAAKVLASLGVTKEQVEAKIAEIGIEKTSDAPPKPATRPTTVALAEGVEVRITDPQLTTMVERGQIQELIAEIVRRAKPE